MAQFTMNAEITLKANAAIRAIQAFEKGAKNSKKEFSLLGRTISLDTKRMGKNLTAMAGILGGLFAIVALQSPHLRAEFKKLAASTLLFNVAIGEILQPTVATFIGSIILLQNKFLGLPPKIQEVIIIAGFLTLALVSATIAATALWAALGPLTLVIAGLALGIAAWMVYNEPITNFGLTLVKTGERISSAMSKALSSINRSVDEFFSRFGLFGEIIGGIIQIAITALAFFPIQLGEVFATSMQIVGDFITALTALFRGDFGGIVDALSNMFIRVFNLGIRTLNNFLIGPLNTAMKMIDDVAETFGGDLNFRMKEIDEIPSKQEGGEIRQDGLIFAHRKERMLTASENRAGGVRGGNQGGQVTIINKNTFTIGSVDSKRRVREIVRDVERAQKRSADRRFKP